jgi:hypothetical protein
MLFRTYLDQIRRTPGPFTSEEFDISEDGMAALEQMSVLFVNTLVGWITYSHASQGHWRWRAWM